MTSFKMTETYPLATAGNLRIHSHLSEPRTTGGLRCPYVGGAMPKEENRITANGSPLIKKPSYGCRTAERGVWSGLEPLQGPIGKKGFTTGSLTQVLANDG